MVALFSRIIAIYRLEICQICQFYTTISLDQKFYTLKMRTSGLFSLTINQRNASISVIWSFFVLEFIWMCKISSLTEESHTRCLWNCKIYRCILYFSAKYAKKCLVFLKNLHSWQEFYTTAGCDGRDKFQVWPYNRQSRNWYSWEGVNIRCNRPFCICTCQ